MSREVLVFIVGILLLVVPQLGIPEAWKGYFFTGSGVILIFVGYSLRRSAYLRSIDQGNGEREADSFAESNKEVEWTDNQ